mmetsp:Transcript_94482/g.137964  ORF Transcript_94482/g.137964 Transcript_94482/m.137964 type:complete len:95 (+) Transcript_94482:221-505(+)
MRVEREKEREREMPREGVEPDQSYEASSIQYTDSTDGTGKQEKIGGERERERERERRHKEEKGKNKIVQPHLSSNEPCHVHKIPMYSQKSPIYA